MDGYRGGQEGHSNRSEEFIRKITTATDRQTERQQHDRDVQAPAPGQTHGRDSEERNRGPWGKGGVSLYTFLGMGVISQSKGKEWGTGCVATKAPLDVTHFSDERSWHRKSVS